MEDIYTCLEDYCWIEGHLYIWRIFIKLEAIYIYLENIFTCFEDYPCCTSSARKIEKYVSTRPWKYKSL